MFNKDRSSPYLEKDRLADVLALIQVLALDEHGHRSESGLTKELQGPPRSDSASSWSELARKHPEFFRASAGGEHPVSLIARHVTPRDAEGERGPLSSEYTSKLLELAVELHDKQFRRSQRWHVWVPVISTIVGGAITLLTLWLTGALGGSCAIC